jgi:hypothetical protein
MPENYQSILRKIPFRSLFESLFVILIFLIIAFQIVFFASLPPVSLQILASVNFIDWSNYGQFAVSFLCTAVALYLYVASSRRTIYLLTGFSSGLWFLSNLFWFLYVKIFGWNLLYPCIADIGFLGTFLLLATAIGLSFKEKKLSRSLTATVYGVPLVLSIAAAVVNMTGQTIVNVLYCLFSSLLMMAIFQYYDKRNWLLFAGVACYCATMLTYILRETYFPGEPILTVVGQLAMVSFCLIPLGLLKYSTEDRSC